MGFKAVVIGASAGGIDVLKNILSKLPSNFVLPIIIVLHMKDDKHSNISEYFRNHCNLEVKEAENYMQIKKSEVYFAPPNYHILVEKNETLTLSVEDKVNYSRPSIDVLFETAADVYGKDLIGIILSGANGDGSEGLLEINKRGGLCIVQDPKTAEMDKMPIEAINKVDTDYILTVDGIAEALIEYTNLKRNGGAR